MNSHQLTDMSLLAWYDLFYMANSSTNVGYNIFFPSNDHLIYLKLSSLHSVLTAADYYHVNSYDYWHSQNLFLSQGHVESQYSFSSCLFWSALTSFRIMKKSLTQCSFCQNLSARSSVLWTQWVSIDIWMCSILPLSTWLPAFLSVSVCLSIFLLVHLSVSLSVSICLPVFLFFFFHLSVSLSVSACERLEGL